jgi:flagellar assembly protein FliH
MDALFDLDPPERGGGRGLLFEDDFGLDPVPPEPQVIVPSYSAADLAAARAEAWAEGHQAGTAEANAATAAATRVLLEQIAAALRDARAQAETISEQSAEAIARLLMDTFAATFPALCARHGEAEVRHVIRTILPAVSAEPTVTVRVNPAHIPALMRELDQIDIELAERVQMMPQASIPPGDVRLRWQDGAAVRDTAELWRQVQAVLAPEGLLTHADETSRLKETEHVN